ncbi:BnaAnng20500D [Brassica napus]|uniref:BnaAnng20500D protein n=1 Tax=Brassica napus TaxID=3708 RepID=A0A078JFE2_BRANA|nr:BnaAnng20500D [Brassica napus]
MPSELLKACYDEENPSTLYIKGVQFFYSLDLYEEGLSLMKRAADAGYERAVYTHAITQAIFEGEGKCQCANLVQRQCHCLKHIDVTKDDNLCNRCFWIKELGLFLRDFEPISLLRDTRKW